MCGLVAVITKYRNGFSSEQAECFDLLLWIDTWRGDDSTGAFVVDNIGNVKLAKDASFAPFFMCQKEYRALSSTAIKNGWAMIGHNRKATRGEVNDKNAHPFIVDDNIVLVHNGSYNGDHKKLGKNTEVDSEAIAHVISEHEDIEQALRKIDAAYALMWYNQDKKQVNIVRNLQRPLYVMETDGAYMYASEEAFLQLVRHKMYKHSSTVKIEEVKDYNLHQFTLNETGQITTREIKELDCSYWKHNTPTYTPHTTHHPFRQSFADECGAWEGMCESFYPTGKDFQRNADESDANVHAANDGDDGSVEAFLKNTNTNKKEEMKALPAPQPRSTIMENIVKVLRGTEVDTKGKGHVARLLSTVPAKDLNTFKFKDYTGVNTELRHLQKAKVIITDIVEADDNPKTTNYLLIGQTLLNPKIYAMFHCTENDFSKVVASSSDAVYEIEVDGITWHRTDPADKISNFEEMKGIVVMHGKNAEPLYIGDNKNVH